MWLRCWRILALQALLLAVPAAAPVAVAGGTSTTLRVTARVVERCTFTTRPLERVPAPARVRVEEVLETRCAHAHPARPARLTIAPPARPVAVEQRKGDDPRHLQITITY